MGICAGLGASSNLGPSRTIGAGEHGSDYVDINMPFSCHGNIGSKATASPSPLQSDLQRVTRSKAPPTIPNSFPQPSSNTYTKTTDLQDLGSSEYSVLSPTCASKAAELIDMLGPPVSLMQHAPIQQLAGATAVRLHETNVGLTRDSLERDLRHLLDDALYAVNWLSEHDIELTLARKKLADHEQRIMLLDIKDKIDVLGILAKGTVVMNERDAAAKILGPLVLKIQSMK